jgi:hypothetical protein
VDVEYFARSNPEDPLEFVPEPDRATVHVESIIGVKGIAVEMAVPGPHDPPFPAEAWLERTSSQPGDYARVRPAQIK